MSALPMSFRFRCLPELGILLGFLLLYTGLSWLVSGQGTWWVVDYVNDINVFHGDDAYRFFLARSAWTDLSLYAYSFVLPVWLVLEGGLVRLAGGDLFTARCLHGLIGSVSLVFLWRAGLRLKIGHGVMFAAVAVMGLMPLYALVSLSFYGEVWLGFFVCVLLFAVAHEKWLLTSIVAAILPLVRPEGIFFLAPLWLLFARKRMWTESLVAVAPGVVYLIFLLWYLPEFSDYGEWRLELRRILSKGSALVNASKTELLSTYAFAYIVPACAGAIFLGSKLAVILVGTLVWIVFLQVLVIFDMSFYEPRYTYSVIPILTLCWALAVDHLRRRVGGRYRHGLLLLLSLIIVFSHLGKLTHLRESLDERGWGWTFETLAKGEGELIFRTHTEQDRKIWSDIHEKMYQLLEQDQAIDRLVIFNPVLYYGLSPARIPDRVRVGYPAASYLLFSVLLDGQIFIMHPGGKMHAYLNLGEPAFRGGERRILYADLMPLLGYPYTWVFPGHQFYVFAYTEGMEPAVDLDRRPDVFPEDVQREYRAWKQGFIQRLQLPDEARGLP